MTRMKIAIILGTRPEIIKMASVIRYCAEQQLDYFIIHTNQHYSENMDKIFFDALQLPQPRYHLHIGSGTHGKQTGQMLEKIEEVLVQEKPDWVLVEGDTNTVLAGALAARKLHIKVGHIEAGLRSYDQRMPEEANRVMTDHISDALFAPTKNQKAILLKEGIAEEKIHVVGNTIVDAVLQNSTLDTRDHLKTFALESQKYFLVTMHRAENVDRKAIVQNIFKAFEDLHQKYGIPLFYPMHPRTKKMVEQFGLTLPAGLIIEEPVGYLEFLHLMKHAKLLLTDSGGIQEEGCIVKIPCVTLRDNTERPETVDVGANIIAGTTPEGISKAVDEMLARPREWENPFGDGKTGERIITLLR